jgi:DNA-binding PadR family transcriptional regulator
MGNKNKGWGYGEWTRIDTKMYTSRAFLSLNSTSKTLLILFLGKRKLIFPKDRKGSKGIMVCENCNELTMTYKELENRPFNFTRPRIVRALDELLAKGFITIVDPGGAYNKHKAVYALSDLWLQWKPGTKPFNKRIRDIKRGFQGQGKGAVSKKGNEATKKKAKTPNHQIENIKRRAGFYESDFQEILKAEQKAKEKIQHTKTLPGDTHENVTHNLQRHTRKRYPHEEGQYFD